MAFLSGFGKRKEIRYGTVFPGANLSDFPKLLLISTDTDIATELLLGGGVAITEADGETEVPFGLYPSSDPSLGTLILRFKTDLLTAASTGDVVGYIYYDSGQTTTEDKAGTVANGYDLFLPMEEDPSGSAPQMFDWVTETNVGTTFGSMVSGDSVTGKVGSGLKFDNNAKKVTFTGVGGDDFTLEAVVKPDNTTDLGLILGNSGSLYSLYVWNDDTFVFYTGGVQHTTTISAGTWYSIAGTNDTGGNTKKIYLNGVQEGSDTAVASGSLLPRDSIGSDNFGQGCSATIDEARVSSVARSADWLEYAHADDFTNEDTFSLGDEEEDGGGGGDGQGSGTAAGSGMVTGVGRTRIQAFGTAVGASTATGVSRRLVRAFGTAAGTSTAVGSGPSGQGSGEAAGISTPTGIGRTRHRGSGAAAGIATAIAVSDRRVRGFGTAAGTSTALASGQVSTGYGTAAGTSTAVGIGRKRVEGIGSATGTSTATARARDGNPVNRGDGGTTKMLTGLGR